MDANITIFQVHVLQGKRNKTNRLGHHKKKKKTKDERERDLVEIRDWDGL